MVKDTFDVTCDCDPFPRPLAGGECTGCSPNETLTCEEESILTQMRGIKEQVRPIADRLREIHQHIGDTHGASGPGGPTSEWAELSSQLEDLRVQWKDWEKRLEAAVERKLIALGHLEPVSGR